MRAVISLGTNTARLLVVRDDPASGVPVPVEHLQIGTRLGEGLQTAGTLAPQAVERTLDAVRAFSARAREFDAEVACIATSAVRRADDRDAFGERVRAVAGAPLAVLDGKAEARASFVGATCGAARDGERTAVLDIGGGSTECAVGCDGVLDDERSIEIGSVRVAEAFPDLCGAASPAAAHAAARQAGAEIDAALRPLHDLRPVTRVCCVAGTPLTLAAIATASHVDRVGGERMSVAAFEATLERLLNLPLAERRALPGMLPQRADILPAGGLILVRALRLFGVRDALLESGDLLLGYLLLTAPGRTPE